VSAVEDELVPPTLIERLKASLFPEAGATTRADHRRAYAAPPSFTDMLPWVEYLPETRQFLFEDGVTRMAVFDIDPIPTEGRSQESLLESMQAMVNVIADSFPELDRDPWVLQIYASAEPDIAHHLERLRDYIDPTIRDTPYTRHFLSIYEEHLRDVSRPEGYFYDDEVSDSIWRGQSFRIRLCAYRRYWDTDPAPGDDPDIELEQVCSKLVTNLDALSLRSRRVDGEGFYYWMLLWLNPRPALCDGDPSRLRECAPYPGDDDVPVGRDFAEMVTLSPPEIDQRRGVWRLDGMPHVVIETLSLRKTPERGQLSGEIGFGGKRYSIMDKLPAGAIVAMTVTIEPQDVVSNDIELIADKAFSQRPEARLAREEAIDVLDRMQRHGDKLYPCELAFYLRAEDDRTLRQHVNRTRTLLNQHGIGTIDPWRDAIQATHFKRNLPGVYIAGLDRKATHRARFMFVSHQASLAPIYGRGRGTDNPGFLFFNRSAEPFSIDPLNPKDRQKNAHMIFVGPPGAGKSSTLNWIIQTVTAVHRPRLFILDVGNSFGLLGDYFEKHGVSVHSVRLTMGSAVSIPPFADAVRLVERKERIAVGDFEDDESEAREELKDFDDEDAERDLLGELEIIARLMITGGEAQEERAMTRSKRMVIRKAIMAAAEACAGGRTRTRTVLPEDVAAAIKRIARTDEYAESKRELTEMADAMILFTDGLNGHLFNRPGEVWPEADVTIVDFADAAQSGREDTLSVAYVSLMQRIQFMAERDQNNPRPTAVLVDESHIIMVNALLALYQVKIVKMWRKLGTWLWLATQNFDDFPDAARKMLSICEYWFALSLSKSEIKQASEFKDLSDEQVHMMRQCVKSPKKYVEAVILGDVVQTLVRVVPPSLSLALSLTEKHEKAEREALMREHGLSDHAEAAEHVARRIRAERLSAASTRKA